MGLTGHSTYETRLVHRYDVAEGTMAFEFEKPDRFEFTPGQFIDMTLMSSSETDAEGNVRAFSIASAPEEDLLMVATRMRDTAFKRALRTMPLGTAVTIEGPFGSLVLHADAARPAVFLAGGIGITPFRSILLHARNEKLPHRFFLFYTNRRPEDAPFLDELQSMERRNPRLTFIGTMTDMAGSHRSWQGETGYIDEGMVAKYLKEIQTAIYYIAGPPAMVDALRAMLTRGGIERHNIRIEGFAGY